MARDYRVYIEELNRYVNFVDRDREIEILLDVIKRGTVFPFAIYGPEGCGKTALLRYIARTIAVWSDTVVVYIDALEHFDVERSLFSNYRGLLELVQDLLSIPIGSTLARLCMTIVSRLAKKTSLRGKNVVVIVDDVYRAIGLDEVDRYTKSLYEWIGYLHEVYNVANVAIILSTSEGISKRRLFRHTYVTIEMLWNLPRKGFEELVEQLNPPKELDVDELWRLTGGNPRALIEIARLEWSIKRWLETLHRKIMFIVHDIDREKLRILIENPDNDWATAKKLEELGLMIYLIQSSLAQHIATPNPELGIGRYWAWQLPAYKHIINKIIEH